jgi:rod shape-determining protein MreC
LLLPLRGLNSLKMTVASLGAENRRLAQLAAQLALENARLKSSPPSQGTAPAAALKLIPAPVIARDLGTLKRFLTVSRGATCGVRIGSVALAPQGVVGKVIAVSAHQALVQTIFEPDFRVAVLNSRTRELAMARPGQENLLNLDYVSPDADYQPGDTIITSGLGGIFPKGLNIGTVKTVQNKPDALFKPVSVQPFVNITRLEQVFILAIPAESLPEGWLENLKPAEIRIPE